MSALKKLVMMNLTFTRRLTDLKVLAITDGLLFAGQSSQLDGTNKAKFAEKVGIDVVMLMTAFQVIEAVDGK